MARKIILKEDGLAGSGTAPSGYKYLGDSSGDISQKVGGTVSVIGGGASEWTETIVNISSAQILTNGGITLLDFPGVGKYDVVDHMIFEFTYNTTPYNFTGTDLQTTVCAIGLEGASFSGGYFIQSPIDGYSENVSYYIRPELCIQYPLTYDGSTFSIPFRFPIMNLKYTLGWAGYDSSNQNVPDFAISDGDGTLRVKIYHKTVTFGA